MRRVQKVFFALAAVAALGWIGASTASAQVQFFVSASGARQVRSEGQSEAVGTIAFAANSTGTIKVGSTITLDFGTPVFQVNGIPSGSVSGSCGGSPNTVTAVAISSGGTGYTAADVLTVVGGTGTAATITVGVTAGVVTSVTSFTAGSYTVNPTNPVLVTGGTGTLAKFNLTTSPTGGGGVVPTATALGNLITLTFGTVDATCSAGNSIQFSGARVNAFSIGAGNSVNAVVSATVPAAFQSANAITLIQVAALTVATVQAAPSTAASGPVPVGANPSTILFCAATNLTAVNSVLVQFTVTEKFASAFTTAAQENGLGSIPAAGGFPAVNSSNVKLRFSMTGIPLGVRLDSAASTTGTTPGLTFTTNIPAGGITSIAGLQDFDLDLTWTATDTSNVETLVLNIGFSVPDITKLTTTDTTTNVKVQLKGGTDQFQSFPFFASNSQLSGVIIRATSCASYLLYSWIAFVPGALDTGMTISNTTADPPAIGTKGQKGTATLYLFPTDGSASSSVSLKNASGDTTISAGQTATFVASSLGKGFTGYGIVVCAFQQGHGIAAFIDLKTGIFGASYEALSLTNPRLLGTVVTEATGH